MCVIILCTCILIYINTLVIYLILFVVFFIEQKSFTFSSISPCVNFGTFNLVCAEENKLDKALAFNFKQLRIKFHSFLWSSSPWAVEAWSILSERDRKKGQKLISGKEIPKVKTLKNYLTTWPLSNHIYA